MAEHPSAFFARKDAGSELRVCVLRRVDDGFDEGLAECRNVVGFSAEDELAIRDDGLVNPVCAGVLDVGLK